MKEFYLKSYYIIAFTEKERKEKMKITLFINENNNRKGNIWEKK